MIDAATFASSYNAFWNAIAPTCEHFVRRLNMDGIERFDVPMANSHTANRAVIAEYAFSLFVERKKDSLSGKDRRDREAVESAAWRATKRRLTAYVRQGLNLKRSFEVHEQSEIDEISERLFSFFADVNRRTVLRPIYNGCGFVDASEGDIIYGETIFEVKTVDRLFRGSDVRQTITYAALNMAAGQYEIVRLGLINPRRGQYCEFELDRVCSEISGRPAQELLAMVVQAISSGEISR